MEKGEDPTDECEDLLWPEDPLACASFLPTPQPAPAFNITQPYVRLMLSQSTPAVMITDRV